MASERLLISCQRWLCGVWIIGCIPAFAVVAIQTMNGYYGAQDQDAWGWLLASTMPTMSLAVGSYVASASGRSSEGKTVDSTVFALAIGLSALYLVTVNGTILFAPLSTVRTLDAMHHMNLLLGALQGLVGTCLGVFFTKHGKIANRRTPRM
jgi:hypothetical protein